MSQFLLHDDNDGVKRLAAAIHRVFSENSRANKGDCRIAVSNRPTTDLRQNILSMSGSRVHEHERLFSRRCLIYANKLQIDIREECMYNG